MQTVSMHLRGIFFIYPGIFSIYSLTEAATRLPGCAKVLHGSRLLHTSTDLRRRVRVGMVSAVCVCV